jgi:hypothetical protein
LIGFPKVVSFEEEKEKGEILMEALGLDIRS